MMDFDPAQHKIVAVVTDKSNPEYGHHFHLSLPDLIKEVREIETQVLPPEVVDRITALEAREVVAAVAVPADVLDRITALESREPVRDLVPVAPIPPEFIARLEALEAAQKASLSALEARVTALEEKPTPLMPKHPANDITAIPAAIGNLVERNEALEDRIEALEGKEDAGADMFETMARVLRMVSDVSQEIGRNRARADGQHGMVVDELSHLAGVIRRAG